MRGIDSLLRLVLVCLMVLTVTSCAQRSRTASGGYVAWNSSTNYGARLPDRLNTGGERVVVVDPSVNAWGAYDRDGTLVRSGLATAGGSWCQDTGRSCRTKVGTFRIRSLGGGECKSSLYPKPNGGGLMPYCMFFSGSMALHGSPDGAVVEANISHGCVRMRIPDAEWMRFEFAKVGTKVIVRPYS